MNELRLPAPASSVSLQLALTRALDAAVGYLHASRISGSAMLRQLCAELAAVRDSHARLLADLIAKSGAVPDREVSGEAGFQQLWMTLVDRRFPTFTEGLPRECERSDRRFERVLLRLWNDPETEARQEVGVLLSEVRASLARLQRLRQPGLTPASDGIPGHPDGISQDPAAVAR